MITPSDIQNKEFARGIKGYKEEDVDAFLDLVTVDFDKVIKENIKLKGQVAALESELEKYKGTEGEVLKVLEKAQELMKDISLSAEKRAEVLLKSAEAEADMITREARENAQRLKDEYSNLRNKYISFRGKYKEMLEAELFRFNTMNDGIFPESEEDRLAELLDATGVGPDVSEKVEEAKKEADKKVPETPGETDIKKTLVLGRTGDL